MGTYEAQNKTRYYATCNINNRRHHPWIWLLASVRFNRNLEHHARSKARSCALHDKRCSKRVHRASESLRSLKDRVRVQNRGGKRILLDGPFAETKEVVGGFFLVNCASKDEALALAAECPAAEWASIEVRETGPCNTGE